MRTIAIMNQKGGVGKTLYSIALVRAFKSMGLRVLAIDTDPQCSLTDIAFDVQTDDPEGHIGKALQERNLKEYIFDCPNIEGVKIIPATTMLDEYSAVPYTRLKELLPQIEKEFDFIVIDCPPTLMPYFLQGPAAADVILTPCFPTLKSIRSTRTFLTRMLAYDCLDKVKVFFTNMTKGIENGMTKTNFSMYKLAVSLLSKKYVCETFIYRSTAFDATTDQNYKISSNTQTQGFLDGLRDLLKETLDFDFRSENLRDY